MGKRGCIPVRWFVHPHWTESGDIKINNDPEKGPISEAYDILVPEYGFAIVTDDGMTDPRTGTPFETGPLVDALSSIVKKYGVSPADAGKFLFNWEPLQNGDGKMIITRSTLSNIAFCVAGYDVFHDSPNMGSYTVR